MKIDNVMINASNRVLLSLMEVPERTSDTKISSKMQDLIIKVVRTHPHGRYQRKYNQIRSDIYRELIFIKIENEVDPSYGESEV